MKKSLLMVISLSLAILLTGCTKEVNLMDEDVNTFTITDENYNSNGYGKARVKGYTNIEEISVCDSDGPCEDAEKIKITYVDFYILETKSDDFLKYTKHLDDSESNFTDTNVIGLGCLENKKISYINSSDKLGMKDFTLNEEDTNKIINSTKESPVILDLERLEFTGGSGAPSCYSSITYVNVVE